MEKNEVSKNGWYLMNDKREAQRLADKVDGEQWVARYLAPYLSPDMAVLDVGCGPGHLAQQVAGYVSSVVGMDLHEERFPKTGLPSNLCLQPGDAHHLPFADNRFDLVYIRFLLEYLPDKQQAVRELVRVTKPGSTILLQDLDGQLVWHYPLAPNQEQVLQEAMSALQSTGFDPYTGRKLFSFLRKAKAVDIQVRVEPYHLIAGAIVGEQKKQWALKLDIAKQALTKLKSADVAEQACNLLMEILESPDILTYSNLFTVVGKA